MNQSWKLISSPINEQPDAISFGGKVEISRTNLLGANRLRAGEDIKILTLENLAGEVIVIPAVKAGEWIPIRGIQWVTACTGTVYWYASGRVVPQSVVVSPVSHEEESETRDERKEEKPTLEAYLHHREEYQHQYDEDAEFIQALDKLNTQHKWWSRVSHYNEAISEKTIQYLKQAKLLGF